MQSYVTSEVTLGVSVPSDVSESSDVQSDVYLVPSKVPSKAAAFGRVPSTAEKSAMAAVLGQRTAAPSPWSHRRRCYGGAHKRKHAAIS